MTSVHEVIAQDWFFAPDGRLMSDVPADVDGPRYRVGRVILSLAPHNSSVWRRLRRDGSSHLVDFIGHAMHVFKMQAVGEPPSQGWSLLCEEVDELQARVTPRALVSALTDADCSIGEEEAEQLLVAFRAELLPRLLAVHCLLAAAANRDEAVRDFLALLHRLAVQGPLRPWPSAWPIALTIRAVGHAPFMQRLVSFASLLRDTEGADRRAAIAAAEEVSEALRALPDELLVVLFDDIDALSLAFPESWPINHWVAGLHFREAGRLAARGENFAAARHYASASTHAPEFADIRDWLMLQLTHLDVEQRLGIEQAFETPESRRLERVRLNSRSLSVALRLGMALDEGGARAAEEWVAKAVQDQAVPADSPASLSKLSDVLGEGVQAAEAWIISNVKPEVQVGPLAQSAEFINYWEGVLAIHKGKRKRGSTGSGWAANRWLTTRCDVPAKLMAACGMVALITGIAVWAHRSSNLRARDGAFAATAQAWSVGDSAHARQSAREFLRLLPVDSTDARADVAANRLRLSTLHAVGALEGDASLTEAKADLRLAQRWLEREDRKSRTEN